MPTNPLISGQYLLSLLMESQPLVISILSSDTIVILLQAENRCGRHSCASETTHCFQSEWTKLRQAWIPPPSPAVRQANTHPHPAVKNSSYPVSYLSRPSNSPIITLSSPAPGPAESLLLLQPEQWITALSKIQDPQPCFPAHLALSLAADMVCLSLSARKGKDKENSCPVLAHALWWLQGQRIFHPL